MRCLSLRWSAVAALSMALAVPAQAPVYANPTTMPADRQADSYAIYSRLLPSNAIEWSDAPRTQWLLEGDTTAEPLDRPCANDDFTNPHHGIHAPEGQQGTLRELLADFDVRCHERYVVEQAQMRFQQGVAGYRPPANDIMRAPATPDEFKGAAGMHRFRAVYFNHDHSVAMTEMGMYCGALCGNWTWVVLQRGPEGWHRLPWATATTMS